MKEKLLGFARLARPANLPTAAADIFAGMSIGLFFSQIDFGGFLFENFGTASALIFSSICLYAAGVVFNDIFDSKLDELERPERPIPNGVISLKEAVLWGAALMVLGVFLAFKVHVLSGIISVTLSLAIFAYDAFLKQFGFFGPLCMGICRGLNLILGMSVVDFIPIWWVALIPILFIFAITLISRGEVHGNNKNHIMGSAFLYAIVVGLLVFAIGSYTDNIWYALPFIIIFVSFVFPPLFKAFKINSPKNIKNAVIAGVMSIVIMDAAWVAGFATWYWAILVLLLLPLSLLLSKLFSVT